MKKMAFFFICAAFFLLASSPAQLFAQSQDPEPEKDLKIGIFEAPPFAMKDSLGNWRGIGVDLWMAIANQLKLSYHWIERSEDELITDLDENKCDAIAGGLIVTPEKEKRVEFSQAFYTSDLAIASRRKAPQNILIILLRTFFSPEFIQIILAICGILLVVGFLIWLVERRANPQDFGGPWWNGIFYGFYWSGAMMSGCGDKAPQSTHGRALALVWIFAGIFLTSSFTASITNILTAEHVSQKTVTQHDLLHHRIAILKGPYEKVLRSINARFDTFSNAQDALNSVVRGQTDACIMSEPVLKYYAGTYFKDKLTIVPMNYQRVFYAFGLPENSTYRERINTTLLEIVGNPSWDELTAKYLDH
jgi:ABC-type amino acid transport substrate-binding protein